MYSLETVALKKRREAQLKMSDLHWARAGWTGLEMSPLSLLVQWDTAQRHLSGYGCVLLLYRNFRWNYINRDYVVLFWRGFNFIHFNELTYTQTWHRHRNGPSPSFGTFPNPHARFDCSRSAFISLLYHFLISYLCECSDRSDTDEVLFTQSQSLNNIHWRRTQKCQNHQRETCFSCNLLSRWSELLMWGEYFPCDETFQPNRQTRAAAEIHPSNRTH